MPRKARLVCDFSGICFVASFAKESAFSFPSMSVWPGAHFKKIFAFLLRIALAAFWHRITHCWPGLSDRLWSL